MQDFSHQQYVGLPEGNFLIGKQKNRPGIHNIWGQEIAGPARCRRLVGGKKEPVDVSG